MDAFNRDLSQTEFAWLPRARESVRDEGPALTAARYPDHVSIDPSCKIIEGRWYAERRRKGDVTVVVAFPPGDLPMIWGVYYNLPLPVRRVRTGGGSGTTIPTSMRELRRRVAEAGLVIETGGSHDKVIDSTGRFIVALPLTPSDKRTIPNVVRDLARKGFDVTR